MPMSTEIQWTPDGPDALTGLPGALDFNRRLSETLRLSGQQTGIAVAVLLLDQYTMHQRLHGQTAVEFTVRDIAGRISQFGPPLMLAARVSANGFGLLLVHYQTPESLVAAVHRVTAEIHRPVLLDQREILATGSIGVVEVTDFNRESDLVRKAHNAALMAQQAGGDRVQWAD